MIALGAMRLTSKNVKVARGADPVTGHWYVCRHDDAAVVEAEACNNNTHSAFLAINT